jgi:hypothetical protein
MEELRLRLPKLPSDLEFTDKINWFMEKFGNVLGNELACAAFSLINDRQENRNPLDEVVFTISLEKADINKENEKAF